MAQQTAASRIDRYVSSTFPLQAANNDWIVECLKTPLLSIEESVIGLDKIVPEIENLAATAKRDCRQNSPLTINESAAICLYTMPPPFHLKLNEALRAQNPLTLKAWYPFLKLLLTAFNQLPSRRATGWRGVVQKIGKEFDEGVVHTWSSLNSCSPHLDVAECFAGQSGTLFCIDINHGKDIARYSKCEAEEEIVLLPGARMRVKSTIFNPDGLSLVHLKEWWDCVKYALFNIWRSIKWLIDFSFWPTDFYNGVDIGQSEQRFLKIYMIDLF